MESGNMHILHIADKIRQAWKMAEGSCFDLCPAADPLL
jgi:hypothetical protein